MGDQVHPVFSPIVQTADEGRDEDLPLLGPPGGGVNGRGLFLRKTKGQVDPETFSDRLFGGLQAFSGGGEFDMGIGDPGKHLLPLFKHLSAVVERSA